MQEGKAIHDFDCKGIISRNLNQDNLHKTRYAKDALIVKMLRCIFTAETLLFSIFQHDHRRSVFVGNLPFGEPFSKRCLCKHLASKYNVPI